MLLRHVLIAAALTECGGGTPSHPDAITQDGQNVYWTTGEGDVFRRAKTGGDPTLVTHARYYGLQRGIWVDDSSVYFISVDDVTNVGALLEAPRTGGPPTVVADSANAAVDASGAYWVDGDPTSSPPGIAIRHRDASGAISTIGTAPLGPIWQLVLDDAYVYWADDRELVRVPKTGGTPSVIAAAGAGREIFSLVVDETRAYYGTCNLTECRGDDMSIQSIGKDGTGPTITYATNEPDFAAPVLAVDAARIYWATWTSGGTSSSPLVSTATIRAAAKDGASPPVTMFEGAAGALADFVVDDARIYWTDPADMTVRQTSL